MKELGVDSWVCQRLARAYGTLAYDVIGLAEERPELAERLAADRPYVAAEVVYSARYEMPVHVEDIAFRRTHVALETGDFEGAVRRIAALMREERAWDGTREAAELKQVAKVREVNERFRFELEAEEGS